jgi:hypothetical protein
MNLHPSDSYGSVATIAKIRADFYVRIAALWAEVNETEGAAREVVAKKINQAEYELEGFEIDIGSDGRQTGPRINMP